MLLQGSCLSEIDLAPLRSLTSDFGIRNLSYDEQSGKTGPGYTLDDNAMALIIQCGCYEATKDPANVIYIKTFFDFIQHCLQPEGYFLNYVDDKGNFTKQNDSCNLADVNGKAIWALGRLISISSILPVDLVEAADAVMKRVLFKINTMHSKRAMGFTIKGLHYYNLEKRSDEVSAVIKGMANKLEQLYKHSSEKNWQWFEGYVEAGDCILPEALLYAHCATGEVLYKDISRSSFDFFLSHTFDHSDTLLNSHSVEYDPSVLSLIIQSLGSFYKEFSHSGYLQKMQNAFGLFDIRNSSLTEKNIDFNNDTNTILNYLHAQLVMDDCFKKREGMHLHIENTLPDPSFLPRIASYLPVKISA